MQDLVQQIARIIQEARDAQTACTSTHFTYTEQDLRNPTTLNHYNREVRMNLVRLQAAKKTLQDVRAGTHDLTKEMTQQAIEQVYNEAKALVDRNDQPVPLATRPVANNFMRL